MASSNGEGGGGSGGGSLNNKDASGGGGGAVKDGSIGNSNNNEAVVVGVDGVVVVDGTTPSFSTPQFQMIGSLGQHGPYTFYKSIKAGDRTHSLSQFIPVKIWPDSLMLNIAEIQLLWSDKTECFCSLKLYFLPENTPDGRLKQHGEDEVIAHQDKVIIRAIDLLSMMVDAKEWDWGFKTPSAASDMPLTTVLSKSFVSEKLGADKLNGLTPVSGSSSIVVLSYPRYTRLRTILKRLEGSPGIGKWLSNPMVLALGALNLGPNCRVLYAKESFDHPDLEESEIFCNHLAPKLKGRKRKKIRKRNPSQGSFSNESVSSSSSTGSLKENEQRQLNGIAVQPKMEIVDGNEVVPKRRMSSSMMMAEGSSNNQVSMEQKLWPPSKRGHRNNGLANFNQFNQAEWNEGRDKAVLLGPALTELAQKLEKSNALQILPIRSQFDEPGMDNQRIPRKKRKTDTTKNKTLNRVVLNRTGPYDTRSKTVSPPIPKDKSSQAMVLVEAHSNAITYAVELNWKPAPAIYGTSPCPFSPSAKMYSDPQEGRANVGVSVNVSALVDVSVARPDILIRGGTDILDCSPPKLRRTKIMDRPSSSSSSSSSLGKKNPMNLDMLQESQRKIPNSNDFAAPSSALNPMGLRLTSEVTLFPSKNLPSYPSVLDGVLQHNFANPRISANAALANSKATPEIDIQPWKPPSYARSGAGGSSSRTSAAYTGSKEQKKHSKGAAYSGSNHFVPTSSPAKSNSGASGSGREHKEKDSNASAVANMPVPGHSQNPLEAYLGKIDPAYLNFLAANAANSYLMNVPPQPPAPLYGFPSSVEQFYKDLLMQAQNLPPPTFSGFSGFYPPGSSGNERKS